MVSFIYVPIWTSGPRFSLSWSGVGLNFFVGIPLGSCKWFIVEIVSIIIFMLRTLKNDVENLKRDEVMFIFGFKCRTSSQKLNLFWHIKSMILKGNQVGQHLIIHCGKTAKNLCILWSGHAQYSLNIKIDM